MNAAEDIGELTAQLARLSTTSHAVEATREGVDAALHGRGAVLALARQVVHDVLGRQALARPGIADLQTRPAGVLAWALDHHPRVQATQSPIDVARASARTSTAYAWEDIGATATRAHVHWVLAEHRPHGSAGGSAVADVAVLAMALTRLEDPLAHAAERLGDVVVTERLHGRHTSGLRLAAEMTLRHSATQDLPGWRTLPRIAGNHLSVLPVNGVAQLPHGLHRLNQLLQVGTPVSPGHLAALLTAQVRMASLLSAATTRAARSAGDAGASHLASRLSEHADALTRAWNRSDAALACLLPSDPRPLQQAGECLRALRTAERQTLPRTLLRHSSALLLGATCATSACVGQQLRAGTWATPRTAERNQTLASSWQLARPDAPPHVAAALGRLAATIRAAQVPVKALATPAQQPAAWRATTAAPGPHRRTATTPSTAARRAL